MEDLAVFTALNHSGSFGKKFVKFKKKKYIYIYIYVIYRLRVGPHFQDRGHSFSPYGPTLSRQITSLSIHCGSKLTFFVERGGRDHSP